MLLYRNESQSFCCCCSDHAIYWQLDEALESEPGYYFFHKRDNIEQIYVQLLDFKFNVNQTMTEAIKYTFWKFIISYDIHLSIFCWLCIILFNKVNYSFKCDSPCHLAFLCMTKAVLNRENLNAILFHKFRTLYVTTLMSNYLLCKIQKIWINRWKNITKYSKEQGSYSFWNLVNKRFE